MFWYFFGSSSLPSLMISIRAFREQRSVSQTACVKGLLELWGKLSRKLQNLHCSVMSLYKISFCFCTLSGRSNVIEKLEALELEHAERMEVEERCSGVRQGRSEMRRFQREVMYTHPNPQCSYSQTLWWFYSRHCHHALPGDAASSRELSMWMWRTLGIPRNSAFKVL